MRKLFYRKGFTLAELLIVVAIIAVLVSIAIPVFNMQLEKSRQAVDLATMRNAETAALLDWQQDTMYQDDYVKYYDAKSGDMTYERPSGYGVSQTESSLFSGVLNSTGIPNFKKNPNYLRVSINAAGIVSMEWTSLLDYSYIISSEEYRPYSLPELKQMSNSERVEADRNALRAIANTILQKGYTKQDLINMGIAGTASDGKSIRLANYYQLKGGDYSGSDTYWSDGFKIEAKDELFSVLSDMGYESGDTISTTRTNNINYTTYENALFYSDQLANNNFIDANGNVNIDKNMRSILLLDVKYDSNNVVQSFKIQTKAMNNESNLTTSDRDKLFSIKVSK